MEIAELKFDETAPCEGDTLYTHKSELGRITVLDRETGFSDGFGGAIRDVETGFTNSDGKFWLVTGDFDIREFGAMNIVDAIALIKLSANQCKGI